MKWFDAWNQTKKFIPCPMKEGCADLNNPGRGWYQIHTFYAEKMVDIPSIVGSLCEEQRLVLVLFHIGEYKDRALDEEAQSHFREIMDCFRQYKKDVILRIVYDNQGKGIEQEPSSLCQVQEHIMQLGKVLAEYTDILYIVQGIIVGSWGEMHSSRFVDPVSMRQLYHTLHQSVPSSVFLAVRRPVQWRILHREGVFDKTPFAERCGLFDDGIFGSEDHLGTFGRSSQGEGAWRNPWGTTKELIFENKLCRFLPNGGEVVWPLQGEPMSQEEQRNRLRQMHVGYLNCVHDERMLSYWKDLPVDEEGIWQGCSMYEYVGAHLGYRFWISNVSGRIKKKEHIFQLSLVMENVGFANCHEEADVYLEHIKPNQKTVTYKTNWDVRTWQSGRSTLLMYELPLAEGKYYLSIIRKKDQLGIKLANEAEDPQRVYLGGIE